MNLTEYSIKDYKEWKARIKETWDDQRKRVIFEGNDGIIYARKLTTQTTTQHMMTRTPTTANLTTRESDSSENGAGTTDTGHVLKIIMASLLALTFIVLIVIWICRRRLKNKKKRVSIRRPLQSEDPDHIYAEIEPLRTQYIECPSTSSGGVPIPIDKQKRWPGIRCLSMYISRLLRTDSKHSATNESILFNKESESVKVPSLPPTLDLPNEDRKGKKRAACQTIQSTSRPLMDTDSQMLMTSSDVLMEMHELEYVYNPLTRKTYSIPYDELSIGNTRSGAQITDHVTPGYPYQNFGPEKENEENLSNADKTSHLYFILEKEEDIVGKDFLPNVTELEDLNEGHCNTTSDTCHFSRPDDQCENKVDHDYFKIETTDGSAGSNYGKRQSTPSKDSAVQISETS
ncbi:hypothetical protein CHS0354_013371 [Potamilus streckersoni]|uniref:Uncharacterized protein n=1 Tax=Potamilus streckersoni TaxID=2493646 RepID=A0AAE0RWJ7_9BIVA|nr:hypothetical protein CHS0354_013371 [Potamilus streckersoni]